MVGNNSREFSVEFPGRNLFLGGFLSRFLGQDLLQVSFELFLLIPTAEVRAMHCVVSAKMFGAFAPPSIGRYNDKWSLYPSENSEERTTVRGHHEEMIAPAQTENLASLAHFDLEQEIVRLKREMNAVILAHYYQDSEIQDLADFVGDSLQLSQRAAATSADVI